MHTYPLRIEVLASCREAATEFLGKVTNQDMTITVLESAGNNICGTVTTGYAANEPQRILIEQTLTLTPGVLLVEVGEEVEVVQATEEAPAQ